jgi:fructose-1,6-bisphosphatase-3
MDTYELKYLQQLGKEFSTVQEVSTELINLTAILNLPKGTEHFLSDIHGEYDTFNHFIKNGSGVIRDKIDLYFSNLSIDEKNQLAFFIYYPKQMIKKYEEVLEPTEYLSFLRNKLLTLIRLSKYMSKKYTKSKIRKSLPPSFAYIIQELIYESSSNLDKTRYYDAILDAIFKTKREKNFLIELSRFIQRLTIDRLHIVGDIFDRGPSAHLVINKMMNYHSIDIEWGNHDVLWMGAASGSKLAICNVLRNSAKYNTLDTLEEGYGINLLPLAAFATKYYGDDNCDIFIPKTLSTIDRDKQQLVAKIHKAITIMQFKLEEKIFKRNPKFKLDNHLHLHQIDYDKNTISLKGKKYPLKDTNFPTIDPLDPYKLIKEEEEVLNQLKNAFLNNDLLQRHISFLVQKGQMYLIYNHNLLFHGCIPLNKDGSFSSVEIDGTYQSGKALFKALDKKVRMSYLNRYDSNNYDKDYFIFLWQGENSPLFGKKEMKTFERYFIKDKATHKEEKNNYFKLRENRNVLEKIYEEFSINFENSKIINGHVPVDITSGENPVKAEGKIYAIDGGMSRQYSAKIGIGGYTLVADSYKLFLISHDRFPSVEKLIEEEEDIISLVRSEEVNIDRQYVYSTDKGQKIQNEIDDLYKLLEAYRNGVIKEGKRK